MNTSIEFIKGVKEKSLPIVKLTKSINGLTGTATFLFIKPSFFTDSQYLFSEITGIYLVCENNEIMSKDINILFKDGKPFLVKTIFIFKNDKEWFQFLQFMNLFSKETGLYFSETIS